MIWDWVIYAVPWPVKVGALVVAAAGVMFVLANIFGWEKVKGWVVPVIGVIAALGLANRSQQQGFNARKAQEDKAAKQAETVVTKERQKAEALPDDKLDSEIDRWSRK